MKSTNTVSFAFLEKMTLGEIPGSWSLLFPIQMHLPETHTYLGCAVCPLRWGCLDKRYSPCSVGMYRLLAKKTLSRGACPELWIPLAYVLLTLAQGMLLSFFRVAAGKQWGSLSSCLSTDGSYRSLTLLFLLTSSWSPGLSLSTTAGANVCSLSFSSCELGLTLFHRVCVKEGECSHVWGTLMVLYV